jgi:DNA-binding LytR/AlgR family response regulator
LAIRLERVNHLVMLPRAMRTLIVDDEPIARQILIEELESFPDVELAGEASNGKEALLKIAELKPDLVFLDLQMPVMSGFEVIQNLQDAPPPVVIIVTAFDQHAFRAFEAGAVDYLLKPVTGARLKAAVERARRFQEHPEEAREDLARLTSSATASNPNPARKIMGRKNREYHLLDFDEVLAFQADRESVWIITARQRLLSTYSLHELEKRLRGSQFRRVHRNAIINVNQVRTITPMSSQRWLLTMSNSVQFIVSKRQASSIRSLLRP